MKYLPVIVIVATLFIFPPMVRAESTASASASPSHRATVTPTATATATPSPSPSPSKTASPTAAPTATAKPTSAPQAAAKTTSAPKATDKPSGTPENAQVQRTLDTLQPDKFPLPAFSLNLKVLGASDDGHAPTKSRKVLIIFAVIAVVLFLILWRKGKIHFRKPKRTPTWQGINQNSI